MSYWFYLEFLQKKQKKKQKINQKIYRTLTRQVYDDKERETVIN